MTNKKDILIESILRLDAGVSNEMLLGQRLVWFLIGSGGEASFDEIVKYYEDSDTLRFLLKRGLDFGIMKEENGTIILVDDEGRRLDYC
jgi:hypothetical protein